MLLSTLVVLVAAGCSDTGLSPHQDPLQPADIVLGDADAAMAVSLAGSTVKGLIEVSVRDRQYIDHVAFFIDGGSNPRVPYATADRAPYRADIDTAKLTDGKHTLTVRVFVKTGRRALPIDFTVPFSVANQGAGAGPTEPVDPSHPTDPPDPGAPNVPADPTPPANPPATGTTELRGDAKFDPSSMPADAKLWYDRFLKGIAAQNQYPDVTQAAQSGDLYAIGRFLNVQVTLMMTAFRFTGDLRLLDEIDRFMQVARGQLKDYNGDGYLNWRWFHDPNNSKWYGDDWHVLDESMTHSVIAAVAWIYQNNRDLRSPTGIDYGERADFWKGYLQNDFEAKWRKRNHVSASDMDFLPYFMLHTYVEFTRYYWYMYRLTGKPGYLTEAEHRADVIHQNLKKVSTKIGDAYVYPWGVVTLGNAQDGLMAVVYGQYVTQAINDMYLDGFDGFDRTDMVRLANGVKTFVMTNGTKSYAQTVGGNNAVGGMTIQYTEGEKAGSFWAIWPYASSLIRYDDSGMIEANAEAQNKLQEGDINNPRRVFLSGAMFLGTIDGGR